MINMLSGGSYDSLLYGDSNKSLNSYANRFRQGLNDTLGSMTSAMSGFVNSVSQQFERVNVMGALSAAANKSDNLFNIDTVSRTTELSAMQHAQPTMRRWIMANPSIRELHNNQLCHGYGDLYIDTHPGTLGEDHFDYRRVNHAVVKETESGNWSCVNYFEATDHLRDELTLMEQTDIMSTWEYVDMFVSKGKDVSSPDGDDL